MIKQYIFESKPFDYGLFIKTNKKDVKPDLLGGMSNASEESISAFESSINCKLPEQYRNYLLSCNGGVLDVIKTDIPIGCDVLERATGENDFSFKNIVVDCFYTLDKNTLEALETELSGVNQWLLPNAYRLWQG